MKEIKLEIKMQELAVNELSPLESELMSRALSAATDAYAPYSNFQVGAAVMLTNGKIITGNNQENAAYPSGMCAERVALYHAGAQYPEYGARQIAIVAMEKGEVKEQISPCGACRQVMLEMETRAGSSIRVLLCGREKIRIVSSVKDLLPLAFSDASMK